MRFEFQIVLMTNMTPCGELFFHCRAYKYLGKQLTNHSVKLASRKIGNTLVPPVGFGAMGISVAYGPVGSDEERFKVSMNISRRPSVFIKIGLLLIYRC